MEGLLPSIICDYGFNSAPPLYTNTIGISGNHLVHSYLGSFGPNFGSFGPPAGFSPSIYLVALASKSLLSIVQALQRASHEGTLLEWDDSQ